MNVNTIKKKKILLLINQNEINNIIEIANRLKKKFKLIFFITDFYSSYDVSRESYNLIKTNFPNSEIFDYYNELKNLNNEIEINKIDFKFLKKFEDKLYSKSIISNFLKDISLNNLYGNRELIYHPVNKNIYYKIIDIVLKKINYIFSKNKIYFVYSPNTLNFNRNLIGDICKTRGIPFYWISQRILNFLFLTNLSDNNFSIIKKIKKKINISKIKMIQNLLIKKTNVIHNDKDLIIFRDYVKKILKALIYYIKNFKNNYLSYLKTSIKKSRPNFFSDKSPLKTYCYWLKKLLSIYFIQKYCLIDHSKKVEIIKQKKFIFYPLHVTPEAGVYDQTELYDQLFLIQKIAKKLPIDTFLVVKCHPSNFKEFTDIEDLNWYKSINKIYNVILLSHHVNSYYLIKKSLATISVSGTACLESNLIGKPSFLIGETEFSGLYGVYKFNDNFLENIKRFDSKKLYKNIFYFDYIINHSVKMNNFNYTDFTTPTNKSRLKYKYAFDFIANKLLAY
jgi:hypothetical protein